MITLIKTLTWLASPLGLLFAFSLAALVLLGLRKAPKTRVVLTIVAVGQLLFFASPWTANTLNQALDAKARALQAHNKGGPYAAIFLLGGMIDLDPATGTINFGNSVDRLWYTAELYHQGLSNKIIVSGGNMVADRYPDAPTQAHLMKNALMQLGVPARAIILEPEALTTRHHIPKVTRLMASQHLHGRLAIVTSAYHMPRAIMNARDGGLDVDAYATDWTIPMSARTRDGRFQPTARSLQNSEQALKEYLGLFIGY